MAINKHGRRFELGTTKNKLIQSVARAGLEPRSAKFPVLCTGHLALLVQFFLWFKLSYWQAARREVCICRLKLYNPLLLGLKLNVDEFGTKENKTSVMDKIELQHIYIEFYLSCNAHQPLSSHSYF